MADRPPESFSPAEGDRSQIQTSQQAIQRSRDLLEKADGRSSDLPEPDSQPDELRLLREQHTAMLAELQHRTSNLIAVIQALANWTMRQTGPTEAFRERFNGQLAALARVQDLLTRSDREPITIRALVRTALEPCWAAGLQDRIMLDGPEVDLRKKTAQSFALALHDLATTACAYGALSTEGGRLTVIWRVYAADGEGHRVMLDWIEEGLSPAHEDASSRRGYDRELIEKLLPYVLQARGHYDIGETELRCSVDLPLKERSE